MKKALTTLLAAALLFAILWLADIPAVWQLLSDLTLFDITAVMSISFVLIYLSAMKWALFLRHARAEVHAVFLSALYLVGYAINLVIPSFVGGDVARSLMVPKVSATSSLAATFLERLTGLGVMLLIAVTLSFFAPGVTLPMKLTVWAVFGGFVLGLAVLISPWALKICSKVLPRKYSHLSGKLEHFHQTLVLAAKNPGLIMHAIFLSLFFHLGTVVNVFLCGAVIGWHAPFAELCTVVPLILLIGAVPVTPAGLGIQDTAYFYFLQSLGATSAEAGAVMVILRAKTYVLALIGVLCLPLVRRR